MGLVGVLGLVWTRVVEVGLPRSAFFLGLGRESGGLFTVGCVAPFLFTHVFVITSCSERIISGETYCHYEMNDITLMFEDWKMTKDRIKHFDETMLRLRIQGIPMAAAIIAAAFASMEYTRHVVVFGFPLTSLILFLGSFYIVPIFGLDYFNFRLLVAAVNHARWIEEQPEFKGKLQVTTKLTSQRFTVNHRLLAFLLYVMLILFGIFAGLSLR